MYLILILLAVVVCYLHSICFDVVFESKYAYKIYNYEYGHLYITLSTKPEYYSQFKEVAGWQPEITKRIF